MVFYPSPYILSAPTSLNFPRVLYASWARGLPSSSASASSQAADAPPDAVLRPDSFSFWQPTSLPATLTLDLGLSRDFDSIGIGAHTLASSGVSLRAESTAALADPYVLFATDFSAGDDGAVLLLDAVRPGRFIRLTLTGGPVLPMPKIGVVYVQKSLVMQKRVSPPYSPIKLARETVLRGKLSRGGQFIGQTIQRQGVAGSAPFKYLGATWVRDNFDPFSLSARRYPYFFAWDPLGFPDEVGYCVSEADLVPEYMGVIDQMQVTIKMRGLGYNQ